MGHGGQPMDVNRIRNHIDNFGDPYLSQAAKGEFLICSACESVHTEQRWYLPSQVDVKELRKKHQMHDTVCPACRKIRDKDPGGVVHLSGGFIMGHSEDILNLITNEGTRAMGINPLERVMEVEARDGTYDVWTTNEKLAQRIGKALFKAYSGNVDYRWSEDNKLVRVFWRRD